MHLALNGNGKQILGVARALLEVDRVLGVRVGSCRCGMGCWSTEAGRVSEPRPRAQSGSELFMVWPWHFAGIWEFDPNFC